jgi:alpha-L-rhamnosidase
MKPSLFVEAKPIWPEPLVGVKNGTAGFRAVVESRAREDAVLRVTGASLFRVTLNGEFLAHGPARAGHGFARVDVIPLRGRLKRGANVVAIEVAGYEVDNYALPNQPSFLQAELEVAGAVVASTGSARGGFAGLVLPERRVKAQRFSFQRPFVEQYRVAPGWDDWRKSRDGAFEGVACRTLAPAPATLPRGVPLPEYDVRLPVAAIAAGTLVPCAPETLWKDRSLTQAKGDRKGYAEADLDAVLSTELQMFKSLRSRSRRPQVAGALGAGEWTILDFGEALTGFIGLQVRCRAPARLVISFDEILTKGDVDFKRLSCVAAVAYDLAPGTYSLETIEPYELRYLKVQVLEGEVEFGDVFLRELANPDAGASVFDSDDPALNAIFEAGRNTFRQNATDIFMDCPSRERAGWLCDSFFTGRVEMDLSGHARVERNFLENFLLPPAFTGIPDGMLPMCYPSDHSDGCYIPNWALWFVLELEEHLKRTGDAAFVDAFAGKVSALFDFFKPFRNADGLLERLQRWVFVEWSKANAFTQDVNYPTNMLYAAALDAAGRLFGNRAWRREAETVRETIRRQSFDGAFFVDNAVRQDGKLVATRNRTETCQYYAFFFDVATPASHPELWRKLLAEFGPCRAKRDLHPEIHPSNALIGSDLRIEILSRYGATRQLLRDVRNYRLPMARRTNTLWEHLSTEASCNHGFASHTCHVLLRDALGVAEVDPRRRHLSLVLTDTSLKRCAGVAPAGEARLAVQWRKQGRALVLETDMPDGWTVSVENRTGRALSWRQR